MYILLAYPMKFFDYYLAVPSASFSSHSWLWCSNASLEDDEEGPQRWEEEAGLGHGTWVSKVYFVPWYTMIKELNPASFSKLNLH